MINKASLSPDRFQEKAKQYSCSKYTLAIIDMLYLVLLLFAFMTLGISKFLARQISKALINEYLIVPFYLLVICFIYYLLDFPLNFYRSFILEHKFSLSQQKISSWFSDQIKTVLISYVIGVILLEVFYYILKYNPKTWWWMVSIFWIFFSLILSRFAPIIIIPLFFKYKRLADDTLRERLIKLAKVMKVKILDVFEIDLSSKTLKANAALVGIGSTRRVILADTLKNKYSPEEIEVILAHEFAHYKLKHLFKLIFLNSLGIIISFYLISKTSNYALKIFGLASLSDIASLPVILIYLVVFGIIMQPLQNYISRRLERNADIMALKITGLKETFVSMLEKLATQNLVDRRPHPLIKFFFFDHPPVDERIAISKSQAL